MSIVENIDTALFGVAVARWALLAFANRNVIDGSDRIGESVSHLSHLSWLALCAVAHLVFG